MASSSSAFGSAASSYSTLSLCGSVLRLAPGNAERYSRRASYLPLERAASSAAINGARAVAKSTTALIGASTRERAHGTGGLETKSKKLISL